MCHDTLFARSYIYFLAPPIGGILFGYTWNLLWLKKESDNKELPEQNHENIEECINFNRDNANQTETS